MDERADGEQYDADGMRESERELFALAADRKERAEHDRCHFCATSKIVVYSTEGVPACAQHAGQLPDHGGPFFIDGNAYDDAAAFADDFMAALGARMRMKSNAASKADDARMQS